MSELIIGTSAYPDADRDLLEEAGIGWLRRGFPFPFEDRVGGEVTESYTRTKAKAQELREDGFRLMGVTPGPGIATYETDEEGELTRRWHSRLPQWAGEPGSGELLETYEQTCRWLADDLGDLVSAWQVANELDIPVFAGPLNPREACDLISAGARGLKNADDSLLVGFNLTAGWSKTLYFFGYLYGRGDGPLDYCGLDGYYGTWQRGGPEQWAERIDIAHDWSGKPVLVNEWGFSSAGGPVTEEERTSDASVCETHKWKNTWGAGHNPEGQAEFVEAAFDVFAERRHKLIGLFFYRWEDQAECWQCGDPDCPAETAWGLVDLEGNPKPAYHEFKRGVNRLQSEDAL